MWSGFSWGGAAWMQQPMYAVVPADGGGRVAVGDYPLYNVSIGDTGLGAAVAILDRTTQRVSVGDGVLDG